MYEFYVILQRHKRILVAVVIVHQSQLSIIVLAAPLDGLPGVTAFRYDAVG